MKNIFDIAQNDKAQMMTIEAFLGAVLIIAAMLFVVSQAPSSIQQSNPHSTTQLNYYGQDTINLLNNQVFYAFENKNSVYDNNLQYFIGEKKFDELNEFVNDTLPDNVGYNIDLYDGIGTISLVQNDNPAKDSITVNNLVTIRLAPVGGTGLLYEPYPWYFTTMTFDEDSLIIPMDGNQNNNITAYNVILRISDIGIPVYQLLQDPRGITNYKIEDLNTTKDPWNQSGNFNDFDNDTIYRGGPYVISANDLNPITEKMIRDWANDPMDFPSSKIDKIEFDDDMGIIGEVINITFTLNDGSAIIINLSTTGSDIDFNSYLIQDNGNNDSQYLEIDASNVAFADDNESKIIGIVMKNIAPFNLTIANVTFDWTNTSRNLLNFTINGNDTIGAKGTPITIDHNLSHDDPARKVSVHKAGQSFTYNYTTWITRAPRIAVYPKAGTMANYGADSGISYTVLDNVDILDGDLSNYDILIIPHTDVNIMDDDNVTRRVIDWVSNGGTLLAECNSIIKIENRVENVDSDNHSWYGFMGINPVTNNTNNEMKFINPLDGINEPDELEYFEKNYTENSGAYLHPLAQSYTIYGTLPATEGDTTSFLTGTISNDSDVNYNNNIMAVPYNGSLQLYDITYMEAPFDDGFVIYLGGHDQSLYSQQRERLIFNSILYSTTAKIYSYGLAEIKITMWYK